MDPLINTDFFEILRHGISGLVVYYKGSIICVKIFYQIHGCFYKNYYEEAVD